MKKTIILIVLCLVIMVGCSLREVTIEGYVFEDENNDSIYNQGEPWIPDVIIKCGSQKAETDSSGEFSISGSIPGSGDICLFLYKKGYQDRKKCITIISDEETGALGPQDQDIAIPMLKE